MGCDVLNFGGRFCGGGGGGGGNGSGWFKVGGKWGAVLFVAF